ncbi:hypothetical protein C8R47DRAFT_1067782 [Mycena vitilis]|nr:hypothetical protein C8R47DRAFT_1067782 [Mycena vitilis]
MSSPSPLYARIRPSPLNGSRAHTQSTPNLRRGFILTEEVPEDASFSGRAATTFLNIENDLYLSEPLSFHQATSEKYLPARLRHVSLTSPTSTIECVPYTQSISSSIENSVVHTTHQSTPPLSPTIAEIHPDGHGYNYLRPPLTDLTPKERNTKDIESENAYIRFQEDLTSVSYPYPFTRSEKAIIRVVNNEYFGVYRRPYELLEAGMRVVCFGDMVGVWFITQEMRKEDGCVRWKWINHDTRYCTVVQVPDRFVRPLTWMQHAKRNVEKLCRKVARAFEIE